MNNLRIWVGAILIPALLVACQTPPPPQRPASVASEPSVPTDAIKRFTRVYQIIRTHYIRALPDDELMDNAIRGTAREAGVAPDRWLVKTRHPILSDPGNTAQPDYPAIPRAQIARFSRAFADIRKLRPDIMDEKLIEAATRGMVTGLGDQSSYVSRNDPRSPFSQKRLAGIGLALTSDGDNIRVVRTIPNSPADKAGIRSGDRISQINGQNFKGLTLDNIAGLLEGDPGSRVIIRRIGIDGSEDDVSLKREFISLDPVTSTLLDNEYLYLRLWTLNLGAVKSLRRNLATAKDQLGRNPRGIILDLRGNSGGLLTAAAGVVDFFLSSGLICRTEGRAWDSKSVYRASPPDETNGIPLTILVDKGTASGAEVIASSLRANRRAYIIGSHTHGMGDVRTLLRVGNNHALSLTTARLSTDEGPIHGRGVIPDLCTSADPPSTNLGEQCPKQAGGTGANRTVDRDLLYALNWLKQQPGRKGP